MAYNYYLVYVHENTKEDTGTNVYAESSDHAKAVGAVLLSRMTGETFAAADVKAGVDTSMQEDEITTT